MHEKRRKFPHQAVGTARSEHFVAMVACWPLAAPSLILLAGTVVPRASPLSLPLGTVAVYGVFAVALAGSLRVVAARLAPAVFAIALLLTLSFAILIVVDPDLGDNHRAVAVQCLILAVPWLAVANAVNCRLLFLRYLYAAAITIVLAGAIRTYFPGPGTDDVAYSQYAGYQMLPAVVIFADDFLHRRRFRSGVLLTVAVVLLLAAGARGPLLAVVLYFVTKAVVAVRARPIFVVGLTAAGLALAQSFQLIVPATLTSLARRFSAQGFSTRAIDRLIAGDFLEDRTRTVLAERSWELILQYPATGIGPARDRLLLARFMGEHDPEMVRGWYPHNIFLELLVQWGVFLGGALIVMLTVLILRAVARANEGATQRVVLIFVGIGLWPLLVSGSYLTSPLFFALLGFCLASRRVAKSAERQQVPVIAGSS